ncbi:MAG: crossover junction endodeoxyribonuclease RuvC [Dehalococcoidia bacterium]|nr:crossover junction endodeoxyribonuclease RuvC [Dehalococcoidia bacterium]
MIVLGVDPGTIVLGYGLIESRGDGMTPVCYDSIKCKARSAMSERLLFLYEGLGEVVRRYRPDVIAIESPFVGDNVKSAFAIGKAQAIVFLLAAQNGIPIYEYSPAQVKHHVADYGASSKEQVQQMVKMLLELDEVPEPNDAADALAVAICHLRESRLREILGEDRYR